MVASYKTFLIELYREYLEEASFLYDQRRTLFDDPAIGWLDLADFEGRFEAHIDGLMVGGDAALAICETQAREGDAGEFHATLRVFLRHRRQDLVQRFLKDLDFSDIERATAAADALKCEMPADWRGEVEGWLVGSDARLAGVVAPALGYRRMPSGAALLNALAGARPESVEPVIRALGRVGDEAASGPLRSHLDYADPAVRFAAAVALLRLADPEVIDRCIQPGGDRTLPSLALGLGGGSAAADWLLERAATGRADADTLLALGLIGNLRAVRPLLDHLREPGSPEMASTAALALELITGTR
jgi:uncharacterized protein (TIGR02270 family)